MNYIQKYKSIEFQVIDMVGKDIPGLEWFDNMWSTPKNVEISNGWFETPPEYIRQIDLYENARTLPEPQVRGITRERLEEIVREVFQTHRRSSIRQGYIPLI